MIEYYKISKTISCDEYQSHARLMPKNLSKGSKFVMPKKAEETIVKIFGSLGFVKQILYEPPDEDNHICLTVVYDYKHKSYEDDAIFRAFVEVEDEIRADKSLDIPIHLVGDPFNRTKSIHMTNPTTILKR